MGEVSRGEPDSDVRNRETSKNIQRIGFYRHTLNAHLHTLSAPAKPLARTEFYFCGDIKFLNSNQRVREHEAVRDGLIGWMEAGTYCLQRHTDSAFNPFISVFAKKKKHTISNQ